MPNPPQNAKQTVEIEKQCTNKINTLTILTWLWAIVLIVKWIAAGWPKLNDTVDGQPVHIGEKKFKNYIIDYALSLCRATA